MSSQEEHYLKQRGAERAHDNHAKSMTDLFESVISFSNSAMRAPALASAGGIAATLGFYSANYSRLAGNQIALTEFNAILFWLFLSLLATITAPGLAYFTQCFYAWSLTGHIQVWEHPYVLPTRKSKIQNAIGITLHILTVLTVISSIIFMMVGGLRFLDLVHTLSPK